MSTVSPAGAFLEPEAAAAEGGGEAEVLPCTAPWTLLPQLGQKFTPGVTWLPQLGQYCVPTGEPQPEQNLSPAWTMVPHLAQFIIHLTMTERFITGLFQAKEQSVLFPRLS